MFFICNITGTWILSASLASPPLFGWGRYGYLPGQSVCFAEWRTSISYTFFMVSGLSVVGGSRIFLGGGANSQSGCILQIFAANCMKMKEFGPCRGRAPLVLPMVISYVALAYNLLIKPCHSSNALKFTKSYLLWSRKLLCYNIQNQHIPLNSLAKSCLIHLKLISTIESILICCIYLLHKYLQLKQFATSNLFCVVR